MLCHKKSAFSILNFEIAFVDHFRHGSGGSPRSISNLMLTWALENYCILSLLSDVLNRAKILVCVALHVGLKYSRQVYFICSFRSFG